MQKLLHVAMVLWLASRVA